jgi:ferritin-like metal-binding protein YciE
VRRAARQRVCRKQRSAIYQTITRYGTLIAWDKQPGRNDAATLLNQTLNEEKATDKKLTEMAESQINRKVA